MGPESDVRAQRHRPGVDLSGPSPGARRVLRQSLKDGTLDANPDIDFHSTHPAPNIC